MKQNKVYYADDQHQDRGRRFKQTDMQNAEEKKERKKNKQIYAHIIKINIYSIRTYRGIYTYTHKQPTKINNNRKCK